MELAASHPDRVGKLVLFDPAVWVPPPVALARAEEKRADESWASVDDAGASRLAAYPKTPRAYLEEETPTQLREMEDGRWRYGYSRAAVIAAYGEMSKPPRLEAIYAPTLLIRAIGSEVVPVQLAEVCRETIPDCTLVEVQHGHELMWESLDETANAARGFLEDLRP
jgi:lipase